MNNLLLTGTITNEIQLSGECSEIIKYRLKLNLMSYSSAGFNY